MPHTNAFLDKLASSSLRLNKSLLLLGALVLLLLGISYLGYSACSKSSATPCSFTSPG